MQTEPDMGVRVRTYRPADGPACRRLFVDGLIGGSVPDGDAPADLDCVRGAYLDAGGHFWVAEWAGETPVGHPTAGGPAVGDVVGMIGVQHRADGTAEVRRLRVDERVRRRGIGTVLLGRALGYCRDRGHLRVILDTFVEREPAVRLFEKFQFRHGRTRRVGERDLLYFYLDLYGTGGSG